MIQTSPQCVCVCMSWPDSNQLQPLHLPPAPKPAPGNFCVTLLGHCMFETPQTWPSWDMLLAVSCAWAPCTRTSLPCSRSWVKTLLIRNAEAKAWTAWMIARAALLRTTCCTKCFHGRVQNANWLFWFARFEHVSRCAVDEILRIP